MESEDRVVTGGLEIVSDASEQVGWYSVRSDILRPPNEASILAICVGMGAQIAVSAYLSVFLLGMFYLCTNLRPHILMISILILAICGYLHGLTTSRMLKFFNLVD